MSEERCQVTYQGESYPHLHGVECVLPAPHPGRKHCGEGEEGRGLFWWAPGDVTPSGQVKE